MRVRLWQILIPAKSVGWFASLLLAAQATAEGPLFPGQKLAAGVDFLSVVVADLDGDTVPDLIAQHLFGGQVSVLLGNGDGTFQAPRTFVAGNFVAAMAVADLDGGGVPDLVTVDSSSDELSVWVGNGDGTFRAAGIVATGDRPRAVAVADLDGDGAPDAVTANAGGSSAGASVLLGNGDGTFQPATDVAAGDEPVSVAVADLDGDGNPDLAVASTGSFLSRGVNVLLGNGDGTFGAPSRFGMGDTPPAAVAVADLDGDGVPDLVTANPGDFPFFLDGEVNVLLGNGDGSFRPSVGYAVGPGLTSVAVADLDRDGAPDLVTASRGSGVRLGEAGVLLGNGDGTFQPRLVFPVGVGPASVAVADLDRDGALDLAIADRGGDFLSRGDVSVLLGNGDGTFEAALSFPAGVRPRAVAIADLDRDGLPDLAIADRNRAAVVLLGNGDGTFQAPLRFAAGSEPSSLAVADLDGDGILDLVTTDAFRDEVNVLLGNGDGTFRDARPWATGENPLSVAAADLDGDGVPDLVTANPASDDVSVLLGNGDGTFQAALAFPAGESPFSVAIADLDGDGLADLFPANGSLLFGNGDGTFQPPVPYETGGFPGTGSVADLNGDGAHDLIVANAFLRDVSILLGRGDGTFQAPVVVPVGIVPSLPAVADLDGDDVPDLVTAHQFDSDVRVLLGNGDGTFGAPLVFTAGDGPSSVAAGDLNGDGVPDLVTANLNGLDVGVLLGRRASVLSVEIDVEPARLNPRSRGVVPVALLGSETFDVADVDVTTLAFGPGAAPVAHRNGPHARELNGDGFPDLLIHFRVQEAGIAAGDTEACLNGETLRGTPFAGCDSIATVPPR